MEDLEMQMLWSPMNREGQQRYATLRAAIRKAYGYAAHTTPAQQLRAKYSAGARRSGDEIFFEAFGRPEQLLRVDGSDDMCADLFLQSGAVLHASLAQEEPEMAPSALPKPTSTTSAFGAVAATAPSTHVSLLAKPTRLKTPARISLKRARESSPESQPPQRKPRIGLSDTTNIMPTSTTTTTMTNPWDSHAPPKPADAIAKPVSFPTATNVRATNAFSAIRPPTMLPRPTSMGSLAPTLTSTRAFALR